MEFLEVPIYDDDVLKLAVRFFFNIFFLALVLFLAIRPARTSHEFAFSVVMMNITTFFICFALKKLELGLGMALGLFAIFGVLRYRTDTIRTKEMTYLFIVIGIAVINALSNKKTSYVELMFVNFAILGFAILKESFLFKPAPDPTPNKPSSGGANSKSSKFEILYDRLDLLAEQENAALLDDLRQRIHIDVSRVRIQSIDLQNSVATLTIWPETPQNQTDPPITGDTEQTRK